MGKPIVNKINTYDATNDCIVTFSYVGNQPYKNRLVVIDTLTNDVVLDETIDNMKFTHTINGYLLTNGVSYTAQISVFDENDNESDLSDKVFFDCYTTPILEIENLSMIYPNTILSSNYNAYAIYSQEQSRALKTYQFCLYDVNKIELKKSDIVYYNSNNDISYQYKGLENNEIYYVRCIGETVDNVFVDSGYYEILASYIVSNTFGSFNVENIANNGYIQCNTHIVFADGETDDDVTIEDGYADLIGKSVVYKEGYVLDGDYLIGLKIKNPILDELLFRGTNGLYNVSLYTHMYEDLHYFKLIIDNSIDNYILYSKRFKLDDDGDVSVYITKKNNLYQLDVATE